MELNEYQKSALKTKQPQRKEGDSLIVSLLGLACEAAGPLAEFKKHIRDGDAHRLYADRMREELGDVLWYLASAASEFDLTLDDIAVANINKTRNRWDTGAQKTAGQYFDDSFSVKEQIPRQFIIRFLSFTDGNQQLVRTYWGSKQMGQALTDNAHHNDGYRFHDIFHLACAAVLGWSPVVRRNLDLKRRSDLTIDEVEDGGRAIVIEEAISALVFDYAQSHAMLDNVSAIDYELLRTIKTLAEHFEVRTRTPADWENAILQGYTAWRSLASRGEGFAICDIAARKISFTTDPSHVQSDPDPDVLLGTPDSADTSGSPVEV